VVAPRFLENLFNPVVKHYMIVSAHRLQAVKLPSPVYFPVLRSYRLYILSTWIYLVITMQ